MPMWTAFNNVDEVPGNSGEVVGEVPGHVGTVPGWAAGPGKRGLRRVGGRPGRDRRLWDGQGHDQHAGPG